MQEKVKLLMEETSCEQAEAELALHLAEYNLERAIKMIATLLQNIVVLKGKFAINSINQYGLFFLIVNQKKRDYLRLRATVSCNPELFETTMENEWYDFEKILYACRLREGSLQTVTQDFERTFTEFINQSREALFPGLRKGFGEVEELLRHFLQQFFHQEDFRLLLSREDLNLDQYRQLRPRGKNEPPVNQEMANQRKIFPEEKLLLEVKIQPKDKGIRVNHLTVGDILMTEITDSRDIGRYLAYLLGGRRKGELIGLPATLSQIKPADGEIELTLQYTPGIAGKTTLPAQQRVEIVRLQGRWWKRLFRRF